MKKIVLKILLAVHIIWWSAGMTIYAQTTDFNNIPVVDPVIGIQDNLQGIWSTYNDSNSGGLSTTALSFGESILDSNVVQMSYSLKKGILPVPYINPYVVMEFRFENQPLDLSGTTGITFYHKGSSVNLQIATENTADFDHYESSIPAHTDWTKVTIFWSDFNQQGWGKPVSFDLSKIISFQWQKRGNDGEEGEVQIKEVQVDEKLNKSNAEKPAIYSIIADAEDGPLTKLGTPWYTYSDEYSTVTPISGEDFIMSSPGANGTSHAAKINYTINSGAEFIFDGLGFHLNSSDVFEPYDLTGSTGISFYHKGSALELGIATTAITDAKFVCMIPEHTDWTKVSFNWSDFKQPVWGIQVPFDISQVTTFDFDTNNSSPRTGEIWIDEVQIDGIELDLTPPKAEFSYISSSSGVAFTNTSQHADKYTWNFGDGQTSTQVHPSHDYAPGVYTVILTAEKARGTKDTVSHQIEIEGVRIIPSKGGNSGLASFDIYGSSLTENTVVKLVKDGVTISSYLVYKREPGVICAIFDLTGKAIGVYDIVVTIDGKDYVMTDGFEIEEANYPEAWAKLEGNNVFIPGRWQTYTVNYGNSGNTDIYGLPLNLIFSNLAEVEFLFDLVDTVGGESTDINDPDNYVKLTSLYGEPFNGKMYSLLIPHIPANTTGSLSFRARVNVSRATKMYVNIGEILNDEYFNTQVEEENDVLFGYKLTGNFHIQKEQLSLLIRTEINKSFSQSQETSRKHFVNFSKLFETSDCFLTSLRQSYSGYIEDLDCSNNTYTDKNGIEFVFEDNSHCDMSKIVIETRQNGPGKYIWITNKGDDFQLIYDFDNDANDQYGGCFKKDTPRQAAGKAVSSDTKKVYLRSCSKCSF